VILGCNTITTDLQEQTGPVPQEYIYFVMNVKQGECFAELWLIFRAIDYSINWEITDCSN